jgi:hypothetical protein
MKIAALIVTVCSALHAANAAAQGRGANPFPGGENTDGSLRPSARVSRLFTQDAYTDYALLAPGSEQFRIRFLTEEARAGATELVNATRGGSEGTDIEVYDPRTGKPMPFTYEVQGESHAIRAKLPMPVPAGGTGRVLIYKTYKDARTYQHYTTADSSYGVLPGDITWVRSLTGYRLGVILPPGYAFLSSNVAAQVSTLPDGRLKLHFANPSGQANLLTVHARKTSASFATTPFTDMFFDDVKTLYDLSDPATHRITVDQVFSTYVKGSEPPIELLSYAPLTDVTVTDLDTGRKLTLTNRKPKLEVPIENENQSAHLQVRGTLNDTGYTVLNGELVFDRTVKGLRNTVLLPAGWEVASVSQSGTIGIYQGRAFVAFVNLNSENTQRVVVRARKR